MSDDLIGEETRSLLQARGYDEATIRRAAEAGRVHVLVLEQLVSLSPQYTKGEVADLTGLSEQQLSRFWRALGFPGTGPDEKVFTDADLDALSTLAGSIEMGLTNEDVAVQLTRVIGASMARIAEAEIQANLPAEPETSARLAELYALTGGGAVGGLARVLEYVWRRHLQAAVRRQAMVDDDGGEVAVGFADLVGFTALSQQLNEEELAGVVGRFEELAWDTIAAGGGRVVKMIGDEVMFVVEDPAMATHIGLALAEAYADDEHLSDVRVGVAQGTVLARDGDYYGPVVNVASRIVNIAFPGAVVVSETVHDAIAEDPDFELHPLRPRVLKDIGRVSLWTVIRPGQERVPPPPRFRRAVPAGRLVVKTVLAELSRRAAEREERSVRDVDGGDLPGSERE